MKHMVTPITNQAGNVTSPEQCSDATHGNQSSSLLGSSDNGQTVIPRECSSVDTLSKLEQSGCSENNTLITNNNVQVGPSCNFQVPTHNTMTNEKSVHEPSSPDIGIHVENSISKKVDHEDSNTHSCSKCKLSSNIEHVTLPLINYSSSVVSDEHQSRILCKEPPGNLASCMTTMKNIPFQKSPQTRLQINSINSKPVEGTIDANGEITSSVPMCFVDTSDHKENGDNFGYCETMRAITLCPMDAHDHSHREVEHISVCCETMRTVPMRSVDTRGHEANKVIPAYYENTSHPWNNHNVRETFGVSLSCLPKSLEQLTSGRTLLIFLVDILCSTPTSIMHRKLLHFLRLTTLNISTGAHMLKKIRKRNHLCPTMKKIFFEWKPWYISTSGYKIIPSLTSQPRNNLLCFVNH